MRYTTERYGNSATIKADGAVSYQFICQEINAFPIKAYVAGVEMNKGDIIKFNNPINTKIVGDIEILFEGGGAEPQEFFKNITLIRGYYDMSTKEYESRITTETVTENSVIRADGASSLRFYVNGTPEQSLFITVNDNVILEPGDVLELNNLPDTAIDGNFNIDFRGFSPIDVTVTVVRVYSTYKPIVSTDYSATIIKPKFHFK